MDLPDQLEQPLVLDLPRRASLASTCRTYFRSVSDGRPRSAATCAIGRPDWNTSRVARSNNATGYFLALAITGASPLHQDRPWQSGLRQTRDGSVRHVIDGGIRYGPNQGVRAFHSKSRRAARPPNNLWPLPVQDGPASGIDMTWLPSAGGAGGSNKPDLG
jgi:hypothetical protein